MRFQAASDSGDGLRKVGSEELVDASRGIWEEVGGRLDGVPEDGAPEDGALDGGVSETLKAVLEERLEGVREGESDCCRDRSSGSEPTSGPVVAVALGGCGGVGS